MKYIIALLFVWFSVLKAQNKNEVQKIDELLNNWHNAAATADFDRYFSYLDEHSIYIGTDATERWTKKEFMQYSKPHFEKGKAWTFTKVHRNIRLSKNKKMAWFDELLDTQMKLCRGSGVLEWVNGRWKISHYVLSTTIPNEVMSKVITIKSELEDKVLESYKK